MGELMASKGARAKAIAKPALGAVGFALVDESGEASIGFKGAVGALEQALMDCAGIGRFAHAAQALGRRFELDAFWVGRMISAKQRLEWPARSHLMRKCAMEIAQRCWAAIEAVQESNRIAKSSARPGEDAQPAKAKPRSL